MPWSEWSRQDHVMHSTTFLILQVLCNKRPWCEHYIKLFSALDSQRVSIPGGSLGLVLYADSPLPPLNWH